jgi:DNA polymerase-3 subunit epsilon
MLRDLLFVDTETTGLDAAKHELLEVAAIRTSPDGKTIKGTFEAKLFPHNIAGAEKTALEVNQYSPQEWTVEKCATPEAVVDALQRLAATDGGTVLVGQNVAFDEGFIKPLFDRFNMKVPWGYHRIDTVTLAWPLYQTETSTLDGLSLKKLVSFLGITVDPKHRAMADAMACREVYLRIMERWATTLH